MRVWIECIFPPLLPFLAIEDAANHPRILRSHRRQGYRDIAILRMGTRRFVRMTNMHGSAVVISFRKEGAS